MAKAKMSNKKFTIAGTSRFKGRTTYRFANGDLDARSTTLKRFEHTSIKLDELPRPMTKVEAIAYLAEKKGVKKAILPTRSPNPRHMSPIVEAALGDTKH